MPGRTLEEIWGEAKVRPRMDPRRVGETRVKDPGEDLSKSRSSASLEAFDKETHLTNVGTRLGDVEELGTTMRSRA